jgi:hypothetical protein
MSAAHPEFDRWVWEYSPSTITLEKVREACIEFVLLEVYDKGIGRHSLDVILGGWQAFSPPRGIYGLYSIITGTPYISE